MNKIKPSELVGDSMTQDELNRRCGSTPTQPETAPATAHTPGPWTAGHHHGELNLSGHSRIFVPGALGIAVYSMGCPYAEVEATADLVAQAPALLAERDRLRKINAELVAAAEAMRNACLDDVYTTPEGRKVMLQFCAAIAKAKA